MARLVAFAIAAILLVGAVVSAQRRTQPAEPRELVSVPQTVAISFDLQELAERIKSLENFKMEFAQRMTALETMLREQREFARQQKETADKNQGILVSVALALLALVGSEVGKWVRSALSKRQKKSWEISEES